MNNYGQNSQERSQNGNVYAPVMENVKAKDNKVLTVFVVITLLICLANTALIALLCLSNGKPQSPENQLEETKKYNRYLSDIADKCLEFGSFKVEEAEEGGIYFSCEIKNTSNKVLDDVYVYYDIFDGNNNFVGSTYSFVPHINAKSSVTVEGIEYFPNAKTIKVVEMFAVYADDIR